MPNSMNTITVDGVTYNADTYGKTDKTATNADSSLNKDAFLQLLVTQMRYQDPLDPQDNSEYLSQLAQFSALEQMTNVASGLTDVSTLVNNIDTSLLVGQLNNMIGKDVQWTTTTTVTDANGNVITDANGNPQTVTAKYEGKVSGVSISDGAPSLIVKDSSGTIQKVQISSLTRIGTVDTDSSTTTGS